VFSLHQESLKLILVDEPLPEVVLSDKSGSKVHDSCGDPNLVLKFLIEVDFSFAQSSMKCLIS
jgi:hypothetical protein